jgi:methionyl-tRNA formyltransferase
MRPFTNGPTLSPGEIVLDGKKVVVGCADGSIELVRVKPAGRVEMEAAAWWRGVDPETRFG